MAINYPGPYELRIGYTAAQLVTPIIQHVQRLNVKLVEPAPQGAAFATYNFIDKAGVNTNALNTLVENWLAKLVPLMNTLTTIDYVELWKYPTAQSFDSVFWSSYTPVIVAGTNPGAAVASSQAIWTFRTQEGGIMKVNLIEGVVASGNPLAYAAQTAAQKAVVDFVLSGDGVNYTAPFLARDTSYPFGSLKLFPGQNERIFKKRTGRI